MRLKATMLALLWVVLGTVTAHAVTVQVEGRVVTLEHPPVIVGNRVLVPLRGVFEALGASVSYDPFSHSIQVIRKTVVMDMVLGRRTAQVNGQAVTLEVPPDSRNGVVMVPLRFISETLGAQVKWDKSLQVVYITPPAEPVAVGAQSKIESVYLMGSKGEYELGDLIVVLVNGSPGGMATFDINDLNGGNPMSEVAPGRYEGMVEVKNGMRAHESRVIAHLLLNGAQANRAAGTTITINHSGGLTNVEPVDAPHPVPSTMFVTVSGPAAGAVVGSDFVVTGETLPHACVSVLAEVQQSLLPGSVTIGTQSTIANGFADAYGVYHVPVHLDVYSPPHSLVQNGNHIIDVLVIGTDPSGSYTGTVELNVASQQ